MSAIPTPYTRQASFTTFQTADAPTVGTNHEAEYNKIVQAMTSTQSRLAEIQRDDGALKNLSVHLDALAVTVRALFAAEAGIVRGPWVTATVYAAKDVVTYNNVTYLAVTAHTSGTFATDLAATKWLSLSGDAASTSFLQAGTGALARTTQDKLREVEYNLFDIIPAAEQAAIIAGTSTYDASADLQQALTNHQVVAIPEGTFKISGAAIALRAGQRIIGRGADKTILKYSVESGKGMFYADSVSVDPANNLKNIYIADLTIDGQTDILGYLAFRHTLGFYGVTDALVERVKFRAFRGDGCYLGGKGLSPLSSEQRHNVNVTFRDCVFDGVVKDNRNGISVIDCDGLTVDNCEFRRIGNAVLSSSVGAIDCEPNDTFSVYRNIKIRGCKFFDIDSVNTAAITFFNGQQTGDGLNIHDWHVSDCTFERCYRGITTSAANKVPGGFRDNLKVSNCTFLNSTTEDINGGGLYGVKITACTFALVPVASASYRGAIAVGFTSGSNCYNGIDWVISGCSFIGLRPQFGCIAIRGVRGLKITDNHFVDITAACISVMTMATAGTDRYVEGIVAEHNSARCQFDDHAATGSSACTGLFVNTSGIDSEFISSNCIARDNHVYGRVQLHRTTALAIFREQEMTAAPTLGTWEKGNKVSASNVAAAGVPGWVCTTAGSLGTLVGVTGDVTNGNRAVLNIVDPNHQLREGQYVTFVNSATAFRIEKISGTTLYLSAVFNGTTAAGVAGAFFPPVFKAMAAVAA